MNPAPSVLEAIATLAYVAGILEALGRADDAHRALNAEANLRAVLADLMEDEEAER